MTFNTSYLFAALVTFALLFVTNVAQAGDRPVPEWQCARELRDAQAASSAQVCRIAGPSRFESIGYGDWKREVCDIRCDLVRASVIAQSPPNLPPEWLQRTVDLRNATDEVERIADNTEATRLAVEALTIKVDRIEAARRAQASASRTSTTTTTTRTSTTTPVLTASSRQELESAWASCLSIEATLRTDPTKWDTYRRCVEIGARLGVH